MKQTIFIEFRGLRPFDYQKKGSFALKTFKIVLSKVKEISVAGFGILFEVLSEALFVFPRILFWRDLRPIRRRLSLIFYVIWISLLISSIYFSIKGLIWVATILAAFFVVLT